MENFICWAGSWLLKAGLVYVRWLLARILTSVKDWPVIRCAIGSKVLDQHLLKVAFLALILLHVDLATIVFHCQRVESARPQILSVYTLFVITTGFGYVNSFYFNWMVSCAWSVLLLACFDVSVVVLAHLLEGEWAWHIVQSAVLLTDHWPRCNNLLLTIARIKACNLGLDPDHRLLHAENHSVWSVIVLVFEIGLSSSMTTVGDSCRLVISFAIRLQMAEPWSDTASFVVQAFRWALGRRREAGNVVELATLEVWFHLGSSSCLLGILDYRGRLNWKVVPIVMFLRFSWWWTEIDGCLALLLLLVACLEWRAPNWGNLAGNVTEERLISVTITWPQLVLDNKIAYQLPDLVRIVISIVFPFFKSFHSSVNLEHLLWPNVLIFDLSLQLFSQEVTSSLVV